MRRRSRRRWPGWGWRMQTPSQCGRCAQPVCRFVRQRRLAKKRRAPVSSHRHLRPHTNPVRRWNAPSPGPAYPRCQAALVPTRRHLRPTATSAARSAHSGHAARFPGASARMQRHGEPATTTHPGNPRQKKAGTCCWQYRNTATPVRRNKSGSPHTGWPGMKIHAADSFSSQADP